MGSISDNARGKIIGDKDGLVKLIFDKQHPQAHRLPLPRRSRHRAGPHRPVGHLAGRHRRYLHRDGVQLPDPLRVLQIRRLRRARQVRQAHLETILTFCHREFGGWEVGFLCRPRRLPNSQTPCAPFSRHSPTIDTKHRSRASRSSFRSARTSSLPPPRSTMPSRPRFCRARRSARRLWPHVAECQPAWT